MNPEIQDYLKRPLLVAIVLCTLFILGGLNTDISQYRQATPSDLFFIIILLIAIWLVPTKESDIPSNADKEAS